AFRSAAPPRPRLLPRPPLDGDIYRLARARYLNRVTVCQLGIPPLQFGIDRSVRTCDQHPHGVTSEIRKLQIIPRRFKNVSLERLTGIDTVLYTPSVRQYDSDAVGPKQCVQIRLEEWPV